MISNARQYKIAAAQAENIRQQMNALDDTPGASEEYGKLAVGLWQLEPELRAYEGLQKRGTARLLRELAKIKAIPTQLIQARIAAGLTQKQLAERLSLKESQIQQYEATLYQSASLRRIGEAAAALADGGKQ